MGPDSVVASTEASQQQQYQISPGLTTANLEAEKLKLEIRDLSRPWWQRPIYLQALLPMTIVLVTTFGAVTLAWTRGFFDAERAKLRQERASLQTSIDSARRENSQLAEQTKLLRAQSENAAKRADELLRGLTSARNVIENEHRRSQYLSELLRLQESMSYFLRQEMKYTAAAEEARKLADELEKSLSREKK